MSLACKDCPAYDGTECVYSGPEKWSPCEQYDEDRRREREEEYWKQLAEEFAEEEHVMETRIRLYDIEWDTDGEEIDLPTEVIIEDPTEEMCEAVGGFDDELADYLSDEYGFCVFGFKADFI